MNEFIEAQVALGWEDLRSCYDVVIVGGGGHGLSTAYHLASRHGITDVAVLERGYIGSGNSGRNTTVIRANYGIPEAVRFYQRSVDLYSRLEEETGRWIMHDRKGLLWLVHGIPGTRNEKARSIVNQAFGADTVYVTPEEVGEICPDVDLNAGGGEYPVTGGSYSPHAATARHDRVVWALAEGAMKRGVHVHQRTAVTGLLKAGDRVTGVLTDRGPVAAGVEATYRPWRPWQG
ncbi:MAG: FAD-dependent oxidoreductase [Acidimicrobiia bacterium]|nr:FAD-dependent oxidoreductase [Acidimicrobiia bacterium]